MPERKTAPNFGRGGVFYSATSCWTTGGSVLFLGEIVQDGEIPLTGHPQFAAPEGHDLDREGLEQFDRAQQIMREQNVTFEDAVDVIYGD